MFSTSTCGIPYVTLLGEKSDYEDILRRIDKLDIYGREPAYFAKLLRPVLRHMIATFDASPADEGVVDFWNRIVHHCGGSGSSTLTGWIIAFCLWGADGVCLAKDRHIDFVPIAVDRNEDVLDDMGYEEILSSVHGIWNAKFLFDLAYHEVDMARVPAGYTTVPVDLSINNKLVNAKITAGSIGVICRNLLETGAHVTSLETGDTGTSSGGEDAQSQASQNEKAGSLNRAIGTGSDAIMLDSWYASTIIKKMALDREGLMHSEASLSKFDTVQPLTGWWIYSISGDGVHTFLDELIKQKLPEWDGGLSRGKVELSGNISVEHPR